MSIPNPYVIIKLLNNYFTAKVKHIGIDNKNTYLQNKYLGT